MLCCKCYVKMMKGFVQMKTIKSRVTLIFLSTLILFTTGCSVDESMMVMSGEADVQTANWGLSFGEEGETPRGNAGADELKKNNAYYVGDTEEKVIYLTFDCGYENGNTEKILDTLKKHNAPAAFFVVGHMIESAPELVCRMADEGHIVGNHTYGHPDMSTLTNKEDFKDELSKLSTLYEEVIGEEISPYYRPPQGVYSEENLKYASELGYKTIFWSLAYVDWYENDQPTKEEAFSKLIPRVHNGAIVLLHQTSATNAAILDELLSEWENMGYRFASLDELE